MSNDFLKLVSALEKIKDAEIFLDKDFSSLSTFRLISRGNLIEVRSTEALSEVLPLFNDNNIKYEVIGLGANQVLPKVPSFILIKLNFNYDKTILSKAQVRYSLPASIPLTVLTSHAQKFGIKGWEVFTGIPATLGGAIFMNAGTALGEISSILESISIMTTQGKIIVRTIKSGDFTYRKNHFIKPGQIIIGATLLSTGVKCEEITKKIREYVSYRNKTQPMSAKTCGCIFKNASYGDKPCGAGQFIDIMGLKGLTFGDVKVGHTHGNFMENIGSASSKDVNALIKLVRDELLLYYGVKFDIEVRLHDEI